VLVDKASVPALSDKETSSYLCASCAGAGDYQTDADLEGVLASRSNAVEQAMFDLIQAEKRKSELLRQCKLMRFDYVCACVCGIYGLH